MGPDILWRITTRPSVLPDALEHWASLRERLLSKAFALFVDYDGTLTPIRSRPDEAVMAESVRERLRRLNERCFVAVVTGRGMEDIQRLVGLPELCYAADHGFEIESPDISWVVDARLRATFEALAKPLATRVAPFEGVVVEPKRFSLALHYRLADPTQVAALEQVVDDVVAREPALRKTHGKKVFELRPTVDWHKGKAVEWLCAHQSVHRGAALQPLYIGDDRTDEDALAQVREGGVGIVVGQPAWASAARYSVRDSAAVEALLGRMLSTRLADID